MSPDEILDALGDALDDTATGLYMRQYGPGWGRGVATALISVVEGLIADAYGRGRDDEAAGLPLNYKS